MHFDKGLHIKNSQLNNWFGITAIMAFFKIRKFNLLRLNIKQVMKLKV